VQIYFDFSGYSDMAIGLARVLGFRLMENFDRPYLSVGFGEFWRRWHISLSTWIREYLYRPLGGNRVGPLRLYVNLWICFWPPASGTARPGPSWRALARLPRPLGILVTFLAVTVGWVLFRAPDLPSAARYLFAMVSPDAPGRFVIVTLDQWCALVIGLAICLLPALSLGVRGRAVPAATTAPLPLRMALTLPLLILAAGKAMTVTYNPFLYFRF
jgi:alginate O-acetyltransferase complex protein AlgI